jgi:hypothetical protein
MVHHSGAPSSLFRLPWCLYFSSLRCWLLAESSASAIASLRFKNPRNCCKEGQSLLSSWMIYKLPCLPPDIHSALRGAHACPLLTLKWGKLLAFQRGSTWDWNRAGKVHSHCSCGEMDACEPMASARMQAWWGEKLLPMARMGWNSLCMTCSGPWSCGLVLVIWNWLLGA